MPDIIVQPAKIEPLKGNDKMRSEADLRKRLETLEEKKAKERKPADAEKEKTDADAKSDKDKDKSKDKDKDSKKKSISNEDIASAEDFQLQRALDLLRAVSVYNTVTPEAK